MTDFRKLAFVGLLSLGLATVGSVGCSSSNNTTGTGGSTGTGGTSSHTGGSTGTGGSGSGTGGAAGATLGCAMSDVPASAEIASFTAADAGTAAMYGTFTYGSTPKPTYTISGGMVNVMNTVQIDASNHYQGFGIYMNGNATGTDCVNASAFTGVQFDLSGSLTGTGCAMVFSINDSEHADPAASTPADPKAGGPAGSYAPQLAIMASQITSTAMTIKVPFTGAGSPAFAGGAASPATAVDPMKLTGVQWQMATPKAADGGSTECVWNINLANVKFY